MGALVVSKPLTFLLTVTQLIIPVTLHLYVSDSVLKSFNLSWRLAQPLM